MGEGVLKEERSRTMLVRAEPGGVGGSERKSGGQRVPGRQKAFSSRCSPQAQGEGSCLVFRDSPLPPA